MIWDFDKLIRFEANAALQTFNWNQTVDGVTYALPWVWIHFWGAGGGGPSSTAAQLGGAGGSGAYMCGKILRPVGRSTDEVEVGFGGERWGPGLPNDGRKGGIARFRNATAFGGWGGERPVDYQAPAEGGIPGHAVGGDLVADTIIYQQGAMGDASAPSDIQGGSYVMRSLVRGADAPFGGGGQINNQDGITPGGGGSPGDHITQSGRGGDARILIPIRVRPEWAI